MKREVFGDLWIILALFIIVKFSANQLDNFCPGLSVILRIILIVLMVPGALSQAGEMFFSAKRYRIAEEFFRIAIPLRRIAWIIPVKYLGTLYLADLNLLYHSLREQQRYKEAITFSEEAIRFAEKRFGSDSFELTECLINHCGLLHLIGDLSAAETVGQRAVQTLDNKSKSLSKRQTENLCLMLNNFGVILADAGKPDQANELFVRSLDLKEKIFKKDDPQLEIAYANQGYALLNSGNFVAAETSLKRALKMSEQSANQDTNVRSTAWNNLGEALRAKGDLDKAEQALNEGLRIRQNILSKTHPFMGYSYHNLGKLYRDQGRFEEATSEFQKALQLREAISPKHPDVAITLKEYAELLRKMGKTEEAERLEKRAQEIIQKKSDPKNQETKGGHSRNAFTTFLIRGSAGIFIILILLPMMLFSLHTLPPQTVPDGLSAARYYDLGIQYKCAGWTEQARDALNRAIKLDSNGKIGLAAARYLKTYIPRYPVPEEANAMNIEAYNESDKTKAKKMFEDCINKFPNYEWPYLNLGCLYLREGDSVKAKEYLNKTLSINPDSIEAWILLANAKQQEKDFAGATQCINKAIDLGCDPNDKSIKDTKVLLEKLLRI